MSELPLDQPSTSGGIMASHHHYKQQILEPTLPFLTANVNNSDSIPQAFCLRWNNYQTNLTAVFEQLLHSEQFVDVTLSCEGFSIKAHKMVLSACSPYFQALFNDNPCKHPIIIMRDVKLPELKAVIEFMYRGEINVCQDQIEPLLRIAELLKIRGLADVNADQKIETEAQKLDVNTENTLNATIISLKAELTKIASNIPHSSSDHVPSELSSAVKTELIHNENWSERRLDDELPIHHRKRKLVVASDARESKRAATDGNSEGGDTVSAIENVQTTDSLTYEKEATRYAQMDDSLSDLIIDEDKKVSRIFFFTNFIFIT